MTRRYRPALAGYSLLVAESARRFFLRGGSVPTLRLQLLRPHFEMRTKLSFHVLRDRKPLKDPPPSISEVSTHVPAAGPNTLPIAIT